MNLFSLKPACLLRRVAQARFARRHPDAPDLSPSAVLLLDAFLKPGDVGLEWGSGRSTLWLARRVMQLYSIEDESHCFLAIKKRLAARGLAHKVVQRFVPCELTELDELESHPYANAALSLPDDALALVLVAGKIRLSCLTAVLPKLAPGGLLALHQANRFLPNRYDGAFTTVHEPRTEPRSIAWADTGRAVC
jgi:predicted O-methyltransferase YrrM